MTTKLARVNVMSYIHVHGANQNNLKNISIDIPKHQLTVFTGRSGSGKSSLVFSVLAAESERLLNETYSSYIQHQLTQYEKPDVDRIENLPVAMVINQKKLMAITFYCRHHFRYLLISPSLMVTRWRAFRRLFNVFHLIIPAACERCQGLGYVEDIDLNELLDFNKSRTKTLLNSRHSDRTAGAVNVIYTAAYLIMIKS